MRVGGDGRVTLAVMNTTDETLQLPDGVMVGEIEPFNVIYLVDPLEASVGPCESSIAVVNVVETTETDRQQQLYSTSKRSARAMLRWQCQYESRMSSTCTHTCTATCTTSSVLSLCCSPTESCQS